MGHTVIEIMTRNVTIIGVEKVIMIDLTNSLILKDLNVPTKNLRQCFQFFFSFIASFSSHFKLAVMNQFILS